MALGRALGVLLAAGDVVLLRGGLGAGKTRLAQGIAAGLGYRGPITSPTFVLVNSYRGGRVPLAHADLYRLEGANGGAGDLGLWEAADEGVLVVEWPERVAAGDLPHPTLEIAISTAVDGDDARTFALVGHGVRGAEILRALGR